MRKANDRGAKNKSKPQYAADTAWLKGFFAEVPVFCLGNRCWVGR